MNAVIFFTVAILFSILLSASVCRADNKEPRDDPFFDRPTAELIMIYSGHSMPLQDRDKILAALSKRNDPDSLAFFRKVLTSPPRVKLDPGFVGDAGLEPTTNTTEGYLREREYAWKYFARHNDFIDSPTLFENIRQYPCVLPYAADYIVSRRARFTPELREQLGNLDLSAQGTYFDAHARYLKIRILQRTPEEVHADSLAIGAALKDSLSRAFKNSDNGAEFFGLTEICGKLARRKNEIIVKTLFEITPRVDGAVAEALGGALADIAMRDFDYFVDKGRTYLGKRKLDDLLEAMYAVHIETEAFKAKYAKQLSDETYPSRREMNIVVNGRQ